MSKLLAYAFAGLVLGLPIALFPYRLARLEEQLDSIGSKRSWSQVEPADWKVALNRYLGGGMALIGGLILLIYLLP